MSRVDDDSHHSRAVERNAQQKRETELRNKERQTGDKAFSRLVQSSQADKSQQARQTSEKQLDQRRQVGSEQKGRTDDRSAKQAGSERTSLAREVLARIKHELPGMRPPVPGQTPGTRSLSEHQEAAVHPEAQQHDSSSVEHQQTSSSQERLAKASQEGSEALKGQQGRADAQARSQAGRAADAAQGRTTEQGRLNDQQAHTASSEGRTADRRTGAQVSDSRKSDAKVGREDLEKRGQTDAAKSSGAKGTSGKDDVRAGNDGGGQKGGQGSGGKESGGGAGGMAPGFRFNPALMAPVPVAQSRDLAGSDRLRRIANEIAQRIVDRVRVGTNAAGAAEFQIDLRSNVLQGMSIKVTSGKGGKISMVFSGSDREALRDLEEQADGLKQALSGRGLKLEDIKFEARA